MTDEIEAMAKAEFWRGQCLQNEDTIAKLRLKLKRRTLQRDSWMEIGWASARKSRADALEDAALRVEVCDVDARDADREMIAAAIRALIPHSAAVAYATAPSRDPGNSDSGKVAARQPFTAQVSDAHNRGYAQGLEEAARIAEVGTFARPVAAAIRALIPTRATQSPATAPSRDPVDPDSGQPATAVSGQEDGATGLRSPSIAGQAASVLTADDLPPRYAHGVYPWIARASATCDTCGNDLRTAFEAETYLVLAAKPRPPSGKTTVAVRVSPPIDGSRHFCGLDCLAGWVEKLARTTT